MIRTRWLFRLASMFAASVATPMVATGGSRKVAGPPDASVARQLAIQAIGADAIDTMTPAALSHDGRLIAFTARSREPSPGQGGQTVYVLDRSTGLITPEAIGPDGSPLPGDSRAPSLSADGRVVAYETLDLLRGDPPVTRRHVVARDRQNGLSRTPQGPRGDPPNGDSGGPVVDGKGLGVVFMSHATNLASAPDANGGQSDVYLWRLDDATITRISVDSDGMQPPTGASHSPRVSGDGELIAFVSTARLAPEDTNDVSDVYLRDARRGLTSLVSRGIEGGPSDDASYSPALSDDGRYVAFVSKAGNLAPRDRNRDGDIYIFDVATRSIALVSATSKGAAANATSRRPALSADGRYVVYQSVASNLGSGPGCPSAVLDTNLLPDVYLFDRTTRCVTRVSGSPAREWWTPSITPAIDASGTIAVFSSTQPLGEDDLSTDFDLFLFERPGRVLPFQDRE